MRRFEVDLVKAIGIATVVLIHSLRPFFVPQSSRTELVLGSILQFAVPGFLAASGFLYASGERASAAVTRRRLARLLVPYLLASLAAHVFWYVFDGRTPAPRALLESLLLASAFGPYYYVLVAVLFVVATPALLRLGPRALGALTVAGIAAQCVLWMSLPFSFFWMFRNPLHWAGFFLAGFWLGRHEPSATARIGSRRGLICGASVAVAGVAALLRADTQSYELGGALSSLFVWSVLLALFAFAAQREGRSRAIRFLSDSTYTIYLFHLFAVFPMQRFVPAPPGVFDPVPIGATWLVGFVAPLLLAAAGRAVLGASRSRALLGS